MTCARFLLHAPAFLVLSFCVGRARPVAPPSRSALPRIDFSVQVGAFADPENALRLIESLGRRGLEAFYYADDDGLNKVRFGNFGSRESAMQRAEALREEDVIHEYFIVPPAPIGSGLGAADWRKRVAGSAMEFLGHPYRWGGPSPETGFDCSGLTMTAYRLNGLALPRTAVEQYATGEPVGRRDLKTADLVFFATGRGRKPTHVGLYIGQGRFIHAPGSGKVVRIDELTTGYYDRRFLAARCYVN
ncbi:MAG: C40 family peptidase [Vicinamibacteria bacterium]|nr:C40 family peptidase [Vicinamibacteria bacterium]